jgi:hypothetical protein
MTFLESNDNSRDGFAGWDHDQSAIPANPAHSGTGMDLRYGMADGGGAAVSDQPSLALQAMQAMMQCHQLQYECLQANYGVSPAVFDWFVEGCRALPVHEQLRVLNEQNEALRQRLTSNTRSTCPATADPSAESVATAANAAPAVPAPVTPAANAAPSVATAANAAPANAAPSVATAANAAPTVAVQLRPKKLARLISLATKAYQCLVDQFKEAPHCRPQRAYIVEMLEGGDGAQFKKDSQHGYLCTDNIVRATAARYAL